MSGPFFGRRGFEEFSVRDPWLINPLHVAECFRSGKSSPKKNNIQRKGLLPHPVTDLDLTVLIPSLADATLVRGVTSHLGVVRTSRSKFWFKTAKEWL